MRKSSLNPSIIQDLLDSAPNALAKGQAQYYTPIPFAQQIAQHLPKHRPILLDLTCGNTQLLTGAANPSTTHLLGADIDPAPLRTAPKPRAQAGFSLSASDGERAGERCSHVLFQSDLTLLYPLMRDIDFRASCFVLNPPWDLHWHRSRLARLAESDLPAVTRAFAAHDGRTPRDTIDSTIATLCLALDRSNPYGEGLLIANHSTIQRLILNPNAPHAALAAHLWRIDTHENAFDPGRARLLPSLPSDSQSTHPAADVVKMRRDQGLRAGEEYHGDTLPDPNPQRPPIFTTSILYFARGHTTGPTPNAQRHHRRGAELRPFQDLPTQTTLKLWKALKEESSRLSLATRHSSPHWNLWLDPQGHLRAHLSTFDEHSERIPKSEIATLRELHGKHPLQLVLQRNQRDALSRACNLPSSNSQLPTPTSPWRVSPDVLPAVQAAILAYQKERAPLYPLSEIQSIGYADEEDFLVCKKNFPNSELPTPNSHLPPPVFRAGRSYAIVTETLTVHRQALKPNLIGEMQLLEYSGQELAIHLTDDHGQRHTFLDARLLSEKIKIPKLDPKSDRAEALSAGGRHSLQTLVEHFTMPSVPDVATLHPETYATHLQTLAAIEQLLAA